MVVRTMVANYTLTLVGGQHSEAWQQRPQSKRLQNNARARQSRQAMFSVNKVAGAAKTPPRQLGQHSPSLQSKLPESAPSPQPLYSRPVRHFLRLSEPMSSGLCQIEISTLGFPNRREPMCWSSGHQYGF